ncbi:MAG: sulfatase-like hydrolase/transferase, partial [Nocardioidaceae bacterium]|nr:sulfatase-like hydrolase/transferase [Nocardioidaceae bacterium]
MTRTLALRLAAPLLIGLLAFAFQPLPVHAQSSAASSADTLAKADVLNKKKPPKKKRHAKKAKRGKAKGGKRQASPQTSRPNIVVVMMDDMRADELAYAPTVTSLLASRGMSFANSFSPYPLCCPARASFLTGQYAHNHGVLATEAPWGFGSFNDASTLAGNMQAAGYNTAMVGKYLNGYGWMPSKVTGGPSRRYKPPGWTDWMASLDTNALELPTLGKGGT